MNNFTIVQNITTISLIDQLYLKRLFLSLIYAVASIVIGLLSAILLYCVTPFSPQNTCL